MVYGVAFLLALPGVAWAGEPPPVDTSHANRCPDASETLEGQRQISAFLKVGGRVIDTCGGHPCHLDGYTGPPP